MKKFLIFIIKFYQFLISPLLGNRCRFLPTCSEYFIESLQKHGLFIGLSLGTKRILKCHPFKKLGGNHGLDFVPSIRHPYKENRIKKIVSDFQKMRWKFKDKKESKNG